MAKFRFKKKSITLKPAQKLNVSFKGSDKKLSVSVGLTTFDVSLGKEMLVGDIPLANLNTETGPVTLETRALIVTLLSDWTGETVQFSDRLSEVDAKPKKLVKAVIEYLETKSDLEFNIPKDVVKAVSLESVESLVSLIETLEGIPEVWVYSLEEDHLKAVKMRVREVLTDYADVESFSDDTMLSSVFNDEELLELEEDLDDEFDNPDFDIVVQGDDTVNSLSAAIHKFIMDGDDD